MKPPLLILCGPTASGKTACAVHLAKQLGSEVVSCDSMQLYRGMDILSAKPTIDEMDGVPHHMLSIAEPSEPYSAAIYRDQALPVLARLHADGKLPILCGGTGLYIDALTKPMGFSVRSDPELHEQLMARFAEPGGREALFAELTAVDPESAARLHINDARRVTRALEVYRQTGQTLTELNRLDAEREGDFAEQLFALDWSRDVLYDRINRRVDQMVKSGLIEEVRAVMETGAGKTSWQALGYKEIADALNGRISMEEAIEQVKTGSRRYAKRQLTWFRRDTRVRWIPAENRPVDSICDEILAIYEKTAADGV